MQVLKHMKYNGVLIYSVSDPVTGHNKLSRKYRVLSEVLTRKIDTGASCVRARDTHYPFVTHLTRATYLPVRKDLI